MKEQTEKESTNQDDANNLAHHFFTDRNNIYDDESEVEPESEHSQENQDDINYCKEFESFNNMGMIAGDEHNYLQEDIEKKANENTGNTNKDTNDVTDNDKGEEEDQKDIKENIENKIITYSEINSEKKNDDALKTGNLGAISDINTNNAVPKINTNNLAVVNLNDNNSSSSEGPRSYDDDDDDSVINIDSTHSEIDENDQTEGCDGLLGEKHPRSPGS